MAGLLQNICSPKVTGVKNREFGDLGKSSLIFPFLAMLFAVQNSSSFTVWFTHREVIRTKKRSRNCVTRPNFRFNAPTALTEEAESISIAAWASNTLKCPFHTTHAAKQQAWKMENRQLLFSMLDDSGRKEALGKKKRGYYHFTKSSVGCCSMLTSLGNSSYRLEIPHISFAADTHQSRAALLWSGRSPRWLSVASAGHTDSISLLLCRWWTIRPSHVRALKKGTLPWDDDWTVITGEMGGPNFWFSAWNSRFAHFRVTLGGRWHMIERDINHLNSRHMEFRRAFARCDY